MYVLKTGSSLKKCTAYQLCLRLYAVPAHSKLVVTYVAVVVIMLRVNMLRTIRCCVATVTDSGVWLYALSVSSGWVSLEEYC